MRCVVDPALDSTYDHISINMYIHTFILRRRIPHDLAFEQEAPNFVDQDL